MVVRYVPSRPVNIVLNNLSDTIAERDVTLDHSPFFNGVSVSGRCRISRAGSSRSKSSRSSARSPPRRIDRVGTSSRIGFSLKFVQKPFAIVVEWVTVVAHFDV